MVTIVGIHVHNGGSFIRIDKMHVKASGSWRVCEFVYAKVSGVWKVVWADQVKALGSLSKTIANIDLFAPCDIGGGFRMQADGRNEFFDRPPDNLFAYHTTAGWLNYDLGRTYQVLFTIDSGDFDVKPTLGVWKTIETPGTEFNSTQTSTGTDVGNMKLEVRRNEGIPTGVLATGFVNITNDCGIG